MKSDALNHFKAEMEKRGLFRKIQWWFSPTKEEVDNMNRAKETADKAAKMLDTRFGGLADLLKTL